MIFSKRRATACGLRMWVNSNVSAMFDLSTELPRLLPKAIAWAEAEAAAAQNTGVTLNAIGVRLARAVGVERPDLVRVVEVVTFPSPADPELCFAARQTGLIGPSSRGSTRPFPAQ